MSKFNSGLLINEKKAVRNYSMKYPEVENKLSGYINVRGKVHIRDKCGLSFFCSARRHSHSCDNKTQMFTHVLQKSFLPWNGSQMFGKGRTCREFLYIEREWRWNQRNMKERGKTSVRKLQLTLKNWDLLPPKSTTLTKLGYFTIKRPT